MTISICTQIKNRLHQFEKTFPINLDTLVRYADIEWVIVDYCSLDNLDTYIKKYIKKYAFLRYYRTINSDQEYSIPIAKNLAARLSSKNYIFNLDCDNFLDNIIEEIKNTDQGVFCDEYLKGTYGRIGLHKDIFIKVGGYDENFHPASVHDNDLLLRCRSVNYNFKCIPSVTLPIANSKADTISMFKTKLSWEQMVQKNLAIMEYNHKKKNTNPNNNIFTPCSLVLNFEKTIEKTNEF